MPFITQKNASSLSKLAHEAKARLKQAKPVNLVTNGGYQHPPYVQRRLSRVRKQLDLVDKRIEEEAEAKPCNGQLLNWLCQAQDRLSEQERILDGRPLPGSMKPQAERQWRTYSPGLPDEPSAPQAVAVPPPTTSPTDVSGSGST